MWYLYWSPKPTNRLFANINKRCLVSNSIPRTNEVHIFISSFVYIRPCFKPYLLDMVHIYHLKEIMRNFGLPVPFLNRVKLCGLYFKLGAMWWTARAYPDSWTELLSDLFSARMMQFIGGPIWRLMIVIILMYRRLIVMLYILGGGRFCNILLVTI